MSQGLQTDINARTTDGTTYVSAGNTNTSAFNSMQAGPQPPSTAELGTLWLDTSNASFPTMRVYDSTAWSNVAVIDATNHRTRFVLDADKDTYIEGTGVDGAARIVSESAQIVGINSSGISVGTATPAVSIDCAGRTDAIQLPVGTDAQAPAPTAGRLRFSSDSTSLKVGNGSAWTEVSGSGGGVDDLDDISNVQIASQVAGQALVSTGTAHWANGTVGSAGLSAGAVVSTTIGTGAVLGTAIADGAITATHLAPQSGSPTAGDSVIVGTGGEFLFANRNLRQVGSLSFSVSNPSFTVTATAFNDPDRITVYLLGVGLQAAGFFVIRLGAGTDYDWDNVSFSKDGADTSNIVSFYRDSSDVGHILCGMESANTRISGKVTFERSDASNHYFMRADIMRHATTDTGNGRDGEQIFGVAQTGARANVVHAYGIDSAPPDINIVNVTTGYCRVVYTRN